MKEQCQLTKYQLLSWRLNYKVWASFILSIALSLLYTNRYISFSSAINMPVQIFESYIIIGSCRHSFTGILLGCLLILSDAPFLNDRSPYEIMRTGAKSWLKSRILYMLCAILIYNLIIFIETSLFSVISGTLDVRNGWSNAITMLAEQNPAFASANFNLSFYYPDYIHITLPYSAVLITFLFNCAYCFIISLFMLLFNLININLNIGWIVAALIHITGYVISLNSFIIGIYISLLDCATPACQFTYGSVMTPMRSVLLFIAIITFLIYFSKRSYSKLQI